jgi:hypothetical protein
MRVKILETDLDNLVGVDSGHAITKKGLNALVISGLVLAENSQISDLGRQIIDLHAQGKYTKDRTEDGVPFTFDVQIPSYAPKNIEFVVMVGAFVKRFFKALAWGLLVYVICSYFTIYRFWDASDPSDQLIIEYGADEILYGHLLSASLGFITAALTLLRKPK